MTPMQRGGPQARLMKANPSRVYRERVDQPLRSARWPRLMKGTERDEVRTAGTNEVWTAGTDGTDVAGTDVVVSGRWRAVPNLGRATQGLLWRCLPPHRKPRSWVPARARW